LPRNSHTAICRELELGYGTLLEQQPQIQQLAFDQQPATPLPDTLMEAGVVFQNAGEEGEQRDDPADPPRRRTNNRYGFTCLPP
jgi:hypothetical protein